MHDYIISHILFCLKLELKLDANTDDIFIRKPRNLLEY